jgi:NitT/TauT family transport system ATP-binding protein
MSAPIVVNGVRKTFRAAAEPVIERLDLTIGAGEFVSLLGPSGCGKTTLLRMMDGLTSPDEGSITIGTQTITAPTPSVGFVFQADALWPWRTVLQNVTFGLEMLGRERRENERIGRELLELVGLTGFERHHPHELSGGMRQRVNIARALAIDPDVLLLDEPFAALDAQTREVMQLELLRIWQTRRKTVVFVTHQIDEAVFLSDRVVVMSARPGRIREELTIPFERTRALELKRTPAFNAMGERIWQLIEDQIAGLRRARG